MECFKSKYRIVSDRYLGFEVQVKYVFFPFWIECASDGIFNPTNTHISIESANEFIDRKVNGY